MDTKLIDKTRIVLGFGRSGTTWVQDAMAEANGLRTVFEPLHPLLIRGAAAYAGRYVAPDAEADDLYAFLSQYLFEDHHSVWSDYRIYWLNLRPELTDFISLERARRRASQYRQGAQKLKRYSSQRRLPHRITKFIRANLMLGWLARRFDAGLVFVIRHPVPVVLSQLRSPQMWNGARQLEGYRKDTNLLEALDEKVRRLLEQPMDEMEALTLAWCIENSIALEQARARSIHVAHYENIIEAPAEEWALIASALALPNVPGRELVTRPSQQTYGQKAEDSRLLRRHDSWRERIESSCLDRVQDILDTCGILEYRAHEPLPRAGRG